MRNLRLFSVLIFRVFSVQLWTFYVFFVHFAVFWCITSLYLFCMFLNNKIATIKTIIMMISLCSFLGNYVYFTHCFHGSWSSINWNEKGQWILFSSFNFLSYNESINCFTITIFSTVLVSCDNTQQRVSSMWNIT